MSNFKNPYVKLERLPRTFIECLLPLSNSSMEEKPEKKNKKQKLPKFKTPEDKIEEDSFSKTEKVTGRISSRRAKQKVKTYNLEDESSVSESDEPKYKVQSKHSKDSDYEEESNYSEDSDRPSFKSRQKKEKQLKTRKVISDSDKDSIHSKDSEKEFGPYYKLKAKKRKGTSTSEETKEKRQKTSKVKELTEYEKLILKNKNEKMEFLKTLKINEVKESFSDAVRGFAVAVKPKKLEKNIKKPKPTILPPRHKIARSSKVEIDLSEEAFLARAGSEAEKALMEIEKKTEEGNIPADLPARLQLKKTLHSNRSYNLFIDDFKGLDQGCTEPIEKCEPRFDDMTLLTTHVKILPTILTALDIHPMREKTVLAGGAVNGCIYLWAMTDPEPYTFKLHSKGFSRLKFIPEYPHLIMCCNRDGLLRKGDLVSHVYNKVTNSKDCTYFDFLSPDTCLVAHQNGYVSVVDMRDSRVKNKYGQNTHKCQDYILRSVSVHPLNKHEFITPTNNGCVRLWDLRKLQEHPIMEVCYSNTNKTLTSAIYSPLTGKSVLTSSVDSKICTSDTSSWGLLGRKMFQTTIPSIRNPIATWQPRTDSVFAVPSKLNPRNIRIYKSHKKVYDYSHESMTTLMCFCTFHPSLPITAAVGKNKIFPFADKKLQLEQ